MLSEPPSAKEPSATDVNHAAAYIETIERMNLRRADAARYVNTRYGFPCSKAWLAKLACVGGGPEYLLAGKFPIYPVASLDAWAQARLSAPRRSTSEHGAS
jgi:hypothetical protein